MSKATQVIKRYDGGTDGEVVVTADGRMMQKRPGRTRFTTVNRTLGGKGGIRAAALRYAKWVADANGWREVA